MSKHLKKVGLENESSRQLFEWQRRYFQRELVYALAFVLGCCLATWLGYFEYFNGPGLLSDEESSKQKSADAAVFALKGQYPT